MSTLISLTLFDYAVALIVVLSVLLGAVRGAVREVLGLSSWIIAFAAAKAFSPKVIPLLGNSMLGSAPMRAVVAFVGVFILALVVVGLAAVLISSLFKKIGLGAFDRILGVVVGLARGVLIVVLLVLIAGFTGLPTHPEWRHAWSSAWFETLAGGVKAWLPESLARRINYGPPRVQGAPEQSYLTYRRA